MNGNEPRWRVWVDTGGTFTDCLALDPDGALHRAKVLSSSALRGSVGAWLDPRTVRVVEDWGAGDDLVRGCRFRGLGGPAAGTPIEGFDAAAGVIRLTDAPAAPPVAGGAFEVQSAEEAPVLAARLVTRTAGGDPLPPMEMRLATTRGTNALLERRGVPVVLFVTRGFRDVLRIGTQQRPDLFALDVRRPAPIHRRVVEVPGRLAADGGELEPLSLATLRPTLEALVDEGIANAAVALLHSYRNPAHEQALEAALRAAGFRHVSRSSALAPAIKLLPRAETAVVDAYLAPIIGDYLRGVRLALEERSGLQLELEERVSSTSHSRLPLHVMTSAGGLVRPDEFRAKDSLLSGPAGGVVGAARAGWRSGFERVIPFDMGGTSTDVARFDGDYEYVWQHEVGGVQLLAPALAIESVAAGGGSVCVLDANGLRVGPESAGARPGPACYGAGGPLTVTDVNLLLGRLDPARFGIPISRAAAARAADDLRAAVEERDGAPVEFEPLLEGILRIADERMADAIRGISMRKGYDPADYALVAFGGAGAQHGCGVAERLGMDTVLVPADAGLLSALGLGAAVVERFAERQVLRPLEESGDALLRVVWELTATATAAVAREGVPVEEIGVRRRIVNLRYLGQEATLPVEHEQGADLRKRFEARYREVYGHLPERRPVEIESVRVIASTRSAPDRPEPAAESHAARTGATSRVWLGGAWIDAPAYDRAALHPGARFAGPALIWERHSATVVHAGWEGEIDRAGAIVLRRLSLEVEVEGAGTQPQPATSTSVVEELFTSRFRALVAEMGDQLQRTALSTNVKERLDFSCALLDPEGELIVNAPHIPVHLGALGECVRRVRDAIALRPGDVVAINHPAFGGSHLPDVTVITPVHDGAGALLGYVANRAHHAEIGGSRPGSMPPDATSLAEEGVVIPPTYLVEGGEERWAGMRALLSGGRYPSRAVDDNLADLRAQVASNHRGASILRELAAAHGRETVRRYMGALADRAERRVREALSAMRPGVYEATERLDGGAPIGVRIEIAGDRARIDFAGTGPVQPGNLNATPAIVRSAVLYVLRLLVREPLPLNEGLMRAVEIALPEGLLNPPFPEDPARAPAVVGGNTEISQRVVDTLVRALGLAACSQGTMNNVLWGSDRFGYYETVCGGAGAGPSWHGESAVHTHMTNTRITDAEVVEHRYPVRVERFEVRSGSGGAGEWRGGDGAVRELTFLEPMSLSVLTQHRVERPYGMEGGEPGAAGRQTVVRAEGSTVELASVDGCEVGPGDRLVLQTPGGGGWGAPSPPSSSDRGSTAG